METTLVLGAAAKDSLSGKERQEVHRKALDAMDKQELDSLYAAYESAVKDRAETENALLYTASLMQRDKREQMPAGALTAMKEVALAAIALARDVALKGTD